MNLMLGDAEETHVTTEKDPTTGEELSKVRFKRLRGRSTSLSPVFGPAMPGERIWHEAPLALRCCPRLAGVPTRRCRPACPD